MGLYDYNFCHSLLYGGWDSGIINNLQDACREIQENFEQMDLENASVEEEMREIVNKMITELNRLIDDIQSTHFR